MMSKRSVVFSSLIVCICFGIWLFSSYIVPEGTTDDVPKEPDIKKTEISGSNAYALTSVQYENMDDIIAESIYVLSGTVAEIQPFNHNSNEFVIRVNETYKGNPDERIYVHEAKNALEMNESYILFLDRFQGGYYPHPVSTSIHKETILHLDGESINHTSPLLLQNLKVEELIRQIKSSPGIHKTPSYYDEVNQTYVDLDHHLTLERLVSESHFIARVIPEDFSVENKYTKLAHFEFLEIYKNNSGIEIKDTTMFMMPAELERDKEYLVFLQYHDGAFYTMSRMGSLIPNDDEGDQWTSALEMVKQTRLEQGDV